MDKNPNIVALVHKYLTSQVSKVERCFIEAWIAQNIEHMKMFDEIKLIWNLSKRNELSESEMEEGLRRLEKTIEAQLGDE